jgi:xylan 1,4-beta-xylosidase
VEGYSFWTFSDIFEENYFPSVPFHGGFGLLTINGIAKPTYRAFELLHRLGGERLLVDGLHDTVNAWVVRDSKSVKIFLLNHALPRHPIGAARVQLRLSGAPRPLRASVERIDDGHANAKRKWQRMGEPEYLDAAALKQLHEASRLTRRSCRWTWSKQGLDVEITLPSHGVALITLEVSSR